MDARNFFDKATKSMLRLNQFGASAGGPIDQGQGVLLPQLRGTAAAHQRAHRGEHPERASARLRASEQRLHRSAIQPLLAAFPVGQTPSCGPEFRHRQRQRPGHVTENSGGARFDYNINDKYRLFARYFRDQGESAQTQNSTGSIYATSIVPQNAVVSLTQLLTPTVINETQVRLQRLQDARGGHSGAESRTPTSTA